MRGPCVSDVLRSLAFTAGMFAAAELRAETIDANRIVIASQGTAVDPDERNALGETIAIPKHPAWYGPLPASQWVSYVFQSGDPAAPGYVVPPNTPAGQPGIAFYDDFYLPRRPVAGWLTVMADDSSSVWLNGFLLAPEAPAAGNVYTKCSDQPIGCLASTSLTLDLLPYLQPGMNTLMFEVAQRKRVSFGLDYTGSVEVIPNPEPSSLVWLAAAAAAVLVRCRKSKRFLQ